MKKLFGFTLSEVLIAMAILGVVSALTIPMISGNTTKKQYITAFKATMNNLQNGIQTFKADNGYDFSGNRTITEGSTTFRQMLEQKLGAQVVKLRTNQQWIAQGVVANNYEIIGDYVDTAGNTISVYANKYFATSTIANVKLDPVNTVQTIAFGTSADSSDFEAPASATNNPTGSQTYRLRNGAYVLFLPNNNKGCNYRNVIWDASSGSYITPDPDAGGDNATNAHVCLAYIDVNGPKGPNRITNCMSNSVLIAPFSLATCNGMTGKEVADIFPILYFDDQLVPANAAGNTVLNGVIAD